MSAASFHRRRSELERLRAWKAEAMAVLSQWEAAWEAAGQPGALGSSKAEATAEEIRRLRTDEEFWRCRNFEHRCRLPTSRRPNPLPEDDG